MGMDPASWAMIASAAISAAGAVYQTTLTSPMQDTTDYELLRQTQEAADAESESAKARIEEARKREELRQQQLGASSILTSETGTSSLSVRDQVLGSEATKSELDT